MVFKHQCLSKPICVARCPQSIKKPQSWPYSSRFNSLVSLLGVKVAKTKEIIMDFRKKYTSFPLRGLMVRLLKLYGQKNIFPVIELPFPLYVVMTNCRVLSKCAAKEQSTPYMTSSNCWAFGLWERHSQFCLISVTFLKVMLFCQANGIFRQDIGQTDLRTHSSLLVYWPFNTLKVVHLVLLLCFCFLIIVCTVTDCCDYYATCTNICRLGPTISRILKGIKYSWKCFWV